MNMILNTKPVVVYRKRTFSPALFLRSSGAAMAALPTVLGALRSPRTSSALREQVMLAVTSVNDCRYCSWVHTGLALKVGVDMQELRDILSTESLDERNLPEATAILFAKHFADTVRTPTQEAIHSLKEQWDADQVKEIMAYIHVIYFANLSGNSMDAWIARLRGQRVESGHPVTEAIATAVSWPILVAIRVAH